MVKNNNNDSFYCLSRRTKCKSDPRKRMAKVKGTRRRSPTNRLTTAQVEDYRRSHLKTIAPHIKKWLFNNPNVVSDVRVVNGVRTTTYSNVVITTVETV